MDKETTITFTVEQYMKNQAVAVENGRRAGYIEGYTDGRLGDKHKYRDYSATAQSICQNAYCLTVVDTPGFCGATHIDEDDQPTRIGNPDNSPYFSGGVSKERVKAEKVGNYRI